MSVRLRTCLLRILIVCSTASRLQAEDNRPAGGGQSLSEQSVFLENKPVEGEAIPLFNGIDLTGWHADVPEADQNSKLNPSFIVMNGLLVSLGTPRGHLITDVKFSNYSLVAEYRFPAAPGNCGILVHSSTPRVLSNMFPASIEVQMNSGHAGDFWCIGENIEVPDMETRRPRSEGQQWGGQKGDARRILNLTDDSEKPAGEWNTMVIECMGNEVRVHVNGDLVNHGFKCTVSEGQIAIQAEAAEVEFRKLEVTPMTTRKRSESSPPSRTP